MRISESGRAGVYPPAYEYKSCCIACRSGEMVAGIIPSVRKYYNRYADITVDCVGTIAEQVVGMIMEKIGIHYTFCKSRDICCVDFIIFLYDLYI